MIWYVEEDKRKYPTVIPSHGILLSGMLRKTFRIDELQCCSDVEVLVCKAVKNVQVMVAKNDDALGVGRDALGVGRYTLCVKVPEKKSAWTDLDRVDFEKNIQRVNVQIEKSAWTGLGKVKKGLFSGKCL